MEPLTRSPRSRSISLSAATVWASRPPVSSLDARRVSLGSRPLRPPLPETLIPKGTEPAHRAVPDAWAATAWSVPAAKALESRRVGAQTAANPRRRAQGQCLARHRRGRRMPAPPAGAGPRPLPKLLSLRRGAGECPDAENSL